MKLSQRRQKEKSSYYSSSLQMRQPLPSLIGSFHFPQIFSSILLCTLDVTYSMYLFLSVIFSTVLFTHTHTRHWSIFSVMWGLKVELCRPLVSTQLQALQGPPVDTVAQQPNVFAPKLWRSSARPAPALHHLNHQRHHPPVRLHIIIIFLIMVWFCFCSKKERRGVVLTVSSAVVMSVWS